MPRRKKPKTISEHIRAAIKDGDVTRYRISQDTNVAESTLSRFVAGERGISMEAIDELAEYLGVEVVVKRKKRS